MDTLQNLTESNNPLSKKQIHALPILYPNNLKNWNFGCAKAAKELGISTERIYSWLKNPFFKNELEQLRSEIVAGAVAKLKEHTSQAIDTLASLLEDPQPTVCLRAANHILDHACKYIALQEMDDRFKQLENRYQELRKLK